MATMSPFCAFITMTAPPAALEERPVVGTAVARARRSCPASSESSATFCTLASIVSSTSLPGVAGVDTRLTHEPAAAVDLEPPFARLALELGLEELLDPLLPDQVVGRVVLALVDLVLLLVDRRDVAEEVRPNRVAVVESVRVLANALPLGGHRRLTAPGNSSGCSLM